MKKYIYNFVIFCDFTKSLDKATVWEEDSGNSHGLLLKKTKQKIIA